MSEYSVDINAFQSSYAWLDFYLLVNDALYPYTAARDTSERAEAWSIRFIDNEIIGRVTVVFDSDLGISFVWTDGVSQAGLSPDFKDAILNLTRCHYLKGLHSRESGV